MWNSLAPTVALSAVLLVAGQIGLVSRANAVPLIGSAIKTAGEVTYIADRWESGSGHHTRRGHCRWIKQHAIETGSRYWWRRYTKCRWL